jgi:hypothetical protein
LTQADAESVLPLIWGRRLGRRLRRTLAPTAQEVPSSDPETKVPAHLLAEAREPEKLLR